SLGDIRLNAFSAFRCLPKRWDANRLVEQKLQSLNFSHGLVVLRLQLGDAFLDKRVGNDQNLLPDVIERQNCREKHHHSVVQLEIVYASLRNLLNPAHGIIGDVADSSADKWRQP